MSSRIITVTKPVELPEVIVDPTSKRTYIRGKFLGKGGFARCYELRDASTKEIFAGKIVSKTLLLKPHQKEKMAQEIQIHRSLNHTNVVTFHSFFEDDNNVYIILELCERRSLMELHKRRKAITEPEARYFLRQIAFACKYLHDRKIIHRDLKLGNLFLNNEMEIKIGDFGLATRLDFDGQRKRTLCGTPNYIAPEVLCKNGHSFEVDVWSFGCIIYTMLVGRPPFETSSLKDTYRRIRKNEYHIPSKISLTARRLIEKTLQADPSCRPNMDQILNDDFLTTGYMPIRLPTSCLTVAPRFNQQSLITNPARRPALVEVNNRDTAKAIIPTKPNSGGKLQTVPESDIINELKDKVPKPTDDEPTDFHLSELFYQLNTLIHSNPAEKAAVDENDSEYPAASPMLWVSKWVDYSDKYGLGYHLCDNSVGVLFNDTTRLILLGDGLNIHYIERNGAEHYHTLSVYPDSLEKKVTLLKYFKNYMNEHLIKAGDSITPRDGDELSRLPYLRTWFRTRSAIVLHLNNGTLQINFFQDHTKIILCPLMGAVTYINEKRDSRTYLLSLIKKHGCSKDLFSRLKYALAMVERLLSAKSLTASSGKVASQSANSVPVKA